MDSNYAVDFLSIAAWNINGLSNKTKDTLFIDEITKHDILFLTESHLNNDDNITISGYHIRHKNHYKPKSNGKTDGGIVMMCKEHLQQGITTLDDTNHDYLWYKLDKNFFNLEKPLYICVAYIPHEHSLYIAQRDQDTMDGIEVDIGNYSRYGYILLLGDLNARSGTLNDFVDADCDTNVHNDVKTYMFDSNVGKRCNQDNITNERGTRLAELCVQCRVRILNGRTLGDSQGLFTCHRPQGCSTVDYMILSEEMLHRVQFFYVHNKLDLSDHCKISMQMKCKVRKPDTRGKINLLPMPKSYKWDSDSIIAYQTVLSDQETTSRLADFLQQTDIPNEQSINQEVKMLTEILHSVAFKSLKPKKIWVNSKPKMKPWYHPSLSDMRHRVNSKGELLRRFPKDPQIRGSYYVLLKEYKRAVKYHRKQFKQDIISKLDDLCERSPQEYWKLLAKLKNETASNDTVDQIDPKEWWSYFTKLNTKLPADNRENVPTCHKTYTLSPVLNRQVEMTEVQKAIEALKNGKASGPDGISNEMIKYGQHVLIKPLTKLFNNVLANRIYPSKWAHGYISPIYKSGNPLDPSNYRGITITSCVAKVLNSVLNNRLETYLTENDMIHESQIAFKKKSRTSDHMFILRTLIEDRVKNDKKNLYACFVDFRKAFDSIPHWALLHKLSDSGLNGPFLDTIWDMYSKTSLCVKVQKQLTPTFPGEVGVRQGDILSPNIFKLFINDLPETVVTPSSEPPTLGSKQVGCLLYADDVVLLSKTQKGLQASLNELNRYCTRWGLQINTNKTKVIVFKCRKPKLLQEHFHLGNHTIDCVNEYKYLGILFNSNGSFDRAQENLYHRGLKAYFKMSKMLATERSGAHTVMHLFDHTVKPILLYASEIWGHIDPKLRRVTNNPEIKLDKGYEKLWAEKLQLKMCRYVLGVNGKTSMLAIRGETGRFPLYLEVVTNLLKYLNHLMSTTSDLLNNALKVNLDLAERGKQCWVSWVQVLLNELGLKIDMIRQPPNSWLPKITRTLRLKYFSLWKKELKRDVTNSGKGNKLRTYNKFKSSLTREPYLDLIKDRTTRKCLAQLRTSSHKLHVETGRYNGRNLTDRTCEICGSNDIEDEEHFLTVCKAFGNDREQLYVHAKANCKNFTNLSNEHKMIWLMTAEDSDIVHALASYTRRCLQLRLEIISRKPSVPT